MKTANSMDQTTESDATVRSMTCETNILSRTDGSANFYQGDTNVLAAIHGPGEVKLTKELLDQATVEVVYKPKVGLPGCAEKYSERVVKNTCESVILSALHPRTAINIILQEMHNSGSLLACCINAACLALLDAAIPLKYMVAGVHCIIDKDGNVVVDPTLQQEKEATAQFTFAVDSQEKNVLSCETKGAFNNAQFQQCLNVCKDVSTHVFDLFREVIKKKLSAFPNK